MTPPYYHHQLFCSQIIQIQCDLKNFQKPCANDLSQYGSTQQVLIFFFFLSLENILQNKTC